MPRPDDFEQLLADSLGLANRDADERAIALAERAFLSAHYQKRTPAQTAAIPVVLSGRDLLLAAPTASGKTEAAFIPIAARISQDRTGGMCIYVAPTRALLNDVAARVTPALATMHLRFALRHGDSALPKEYEDLAFLMTTPESLDYLLTAAPNLVRRVQWAILDEIHQLYGSARGEQLRFLMKRLDLLSGRHVQTIAMSATVADPAALRDWLFKGTADLSQIETRRELDVEVRYGPLATCLRQTIMTGEHQKVLVFANSRRRCEELHQAVAGIDVFETYVHYSSLSRSERLAVERGFARSNLAICVATSTLELGVDIGSVELVVLADPPVDTAAFLQRAGRAGRRDSRSKVVCLAESPESLLLAMAGALLASEGKLEANNLGPTLGVVVQQIFSYMASKANHRAHPSEFERLFSHTDSNVVEQLEIIIQSLVDQDYLDYDPVWNSYTAGQALEAILNSPTVHSNIMDGGGGIAVYAGNRSIGSVSGSPGEISEGKVMVMGGRYWEVIRLDADRLTVMPSPPVSGATTPRWSSRGGATVGRMMAQRCLEIVSMNARGQLKLDDGSERVLEGLRDVLGGNLGNSMPYWRDKRSVETVTFAGDLGNALLSLIFRDNGLKCRPTRGRKFMSLASNRPLNPSLIPSEAGSVQALAQRHWRTLASYAEQASFSSLLPTAQRKAEVLAQVTSPEILNFVVGFRRKRAFEVDVPWPGDPG